MSKEFDQAESIREQHTVLALEVIETLLSCEELSDEVKLKEIKKTIEGWRNPPQFGISEWSEQLKKKILDHDEE